MKITQNSTVCFVILFVFFAINLKGQEIKNEGYVINGTVKGIDSGIVRMISRDRKSVYDSSTIVKGKFSMKGKIGMPERMVFNFSPGNWSFQAFVEDTVLTLSIDTTGAEHYDNGHDKWALIWDIDEAGSSISDVYTKYNKETNQKYYLNVCLSLRKKLSAVKGNKDAEFKVKQEIDSVGNLLFASEKTWIESFTGQYPTSIAGAYLFYEYYQSSNKVSLTCLDSTLNRFSGVATSSFYYKELAGTASKLKKIQPDRLAPNFTLLKKDKSPFTLSSLRGKYVLIDFWASWCIPCRKAIPQWKVAYAKYKHKGLMIVSVSDDRKENDWIRALNKEQMPWVQVVDKFPDEVQPALAGELYGTKSIPFYVLLDKEGKVIISSNEEKVMREKIEEILH